MWLHIDFWFQRGKNWRTDYYLNKKEQGDFEELLTDLIKRLSPSRKFYLYEDIPSCFLALEDVDIEEAKRIIRRIKRPYIYKCFVNLDKQNDDKANGEGFLNILNAFTDFYLFKKDNRITHIVHCCMEFMLQSRQKECEFYQNMAINYQIAIRKGKKIVYGYKKITPEIRKRMIKWIKSLDLRRKNVVKD